MNKADKLLEDLREVDLFNVDSVNYGNRKHYIDQLESVVRQQQAEIEALKESNKNLMELVTMLREEVNSLRQLQAENEALKKNLDIALMMIDNRNDIIDKLDLK